GTRHATAALVPARGDCDRAVGRAATALAAATAGPLPRMSFHPNDVARRSRGAKIFVLVAFAWLSSGFYRAQALRHAEYVMQSEENRLREVPLPAPRGIIYDRNGKVIAENLPGYTVSVLSPSPDSLRETLRKLRTVIPFTDDDIETAVRRFNRAPYRPAVLLA